MRDVQDRRATTPARDVSCLGVAVIGTGSMGTRHLRLLAQHERVRPVAVPLRPARARELAAEGVTTAADLQGAVRLGVTAAIIATDTGRHLPDAVAAMQEGLDLLVEKPLARDACEAGHLVQRALALRRRLFTGCMLRFNESLNWFRDRLPLLGRLHAVRIECQSSLPGWRPQRPYLDSYSARADEGGVLRDVIHEIDYAGWLYGWPKALQAQVRNAGRLGIEAEEIAELFWETPRGGLISVCVDYLTTPTHRRMRACGERGTLEWDGVAGTVAAALEGSEVTLLRSRQSRDEMFMAQTRAFVEAVQGRDDSRLATGLDGVMALAVCDAARRASASRREEPVRVG